MTQQSHQRDSLDVTDDSGDWGGYLLRMLTHDGNGYCLHEPLRTFDARTRTVIEHFEKIGRSTDPGDLTGSDIVHFDFHPGNLLQTAGRLTAVVDMDNARIGDAVFDLTMLAIASLGGAVDPGVRSRLFDHGVDALPQMKHDVCVANLLLRYLDWSIRKSRLSEVDFWLAQTDRLLSH
ncbi:MAG: aminoglycoside phosphotransferase family protein [Actinobacteria bacterium]|nr:aminoglycoside phosphotransferase family protein [Actinomycetota bacterium]